MKIIVKDYTCNNKKNINKKIVSISDLHLSPIVNIKLITKIVDHISLLNPDYITFLGDINDSGAFITNPELVKEYETFTKELSEIAKTFVILGNHDLSLSHSDKAKELSINEKYNYFRGFKNTILLNNSVYYDDDICFINYAKKLNGYDNEWDKKDILIRELNKLNSRLRLGKDTYNVLLTHSPIYMLDDEVIEKCPLIKKMDLILAGHTHNGLVPNCMEKIIPHNKGINCNYKLVDQTRNEQEVNGINMIINGGVTKIDHFKPKALRGFSPLYPAEIDEIKIKSLKQ